MRRARRAEEGFGDAKQVEGVGAGEVVLAVFLGFVGVDSDDEIVLFAQGGGEVGDVGGLVLAAEKDLVFGDLAAAGGGRDLLDEEVDPGGVVFHREGGLEDVAVAVADERDVFALGVVEGDAENLAGIAGALEDGAEEDVLVSIDGCGFVAGMFSWHREDTMLGTFQSSAEAVRRA